MWQRVAVVSILAISACSSVTERNQPTRTQDLWQVYNDAFKSAKYVDLTHTIAPSTPVWKGFGPSKFSATVDPGTGKAYTYAKDGFEATHYDLTTDQLGTQLD